MEGFPIHWERVMEMDSPFVVAQQQAMLWRRGERCVCMCLRVMALKQTLGRVFQQARRFEYVEGCSLGSVGQEDQWLQ